MISFRGDAHKFYLKVKKTYHRQKKLEDIAELKEIKEIRKIEQMYRKIPIDTLKKIRYRMIKEKNGTGIIPILVSSLPWLGFIFSKQLQAILFQEERPLWPWFILLYGLITLSTVIIHYREKAWASVHIELIEQTIDEKLKAEG